MGRSRSPATPNPSAVIQFSIHRSPVRYADEVSSLGDGQFAVLKVYDPLGREVATLVNEVKKPGEHRVEWNAEGMPSGVYFCRLQSGDLVLTRKLLLMK